MSIALVNFSHIGGLHDVARMRTTSPPTTNSAAKPTASEAVGGDRYVGGFSAVGGTGSLSAAYQAMRRFEAQASEVVLASPSQEAAHPPGSAHAFAAYAETRSFASEEA